MSTPIKFAILAVDTVCFSIIDKSLCILIGRINNPNNPFHDKWAHIGGLIKVDETSEQAVDRLLKDKAGVRNSYKEQLYTFSEIKRDPRGRVVSVGYIVLLPDQKDCDEELASVEIKWVPVDSKQRLAYDHDKILALAIERLRSKINYTDIARYLLPVEFTLSDLQQVYEIVLGEKIDKRNFRKKILSDNLLKDTKRMKKGGAMRPALLYTFK